MKWISTTSIASIASTASTAAALALSAATTAAAAGTMPPTSVVDGDRVTIVDADTIALPCAVIYRGCAEKIRLTGIDAPETYRPSCSHELEVGLEAKQRVAALIRGHEVTVIRSGKLDRYGRTLADIQVEAADGTAVDIGDILMQEGLALQYRPGRPAKLARIQHWCPNYVEGE